MNHARKTYKQIRNEALKKKIPLFDELDVNIPQGLAIKTFTHASFRHEYNIENPDSPIEDNEKLEFYGDAVLEYIITDFIYKAASKNRDLDEGNMTKIRTNLVSNESLAGIGKKYELGKYLLLSKTLKSHNAENQDIINARALEALLGAINIHCGIEKTTQVVEKLFGEELKKLKANPADAEKIDYVSAFKLLAAELFDTEPDYIIEDSGPAHDKVFYATPILKNTEALKDDESTGSTDDKSGSDLQYNKSGSGSKGDKAVSRGKQIKKFETEQGKSKKEARMNAAKRAYEDLKTQSKK